ncbi:MAG TPA: transglutaminase domain-containing protein [Candidatus Methylacidiphilales bacterium]|jgi:transglutaminase-like putative cysteine protease|nr:transglutaminase domain-containing protein [Candidatus Methylacidiphilales bacterium]
MNHPPLELTVRVGCHVVWLASIPVATTLTLRPRDNPHQKVLQQQLTFAPHLASFSFEDGLGNQVDRVIMQPGENIIHHDAIVQVPSTPDNFEPTGLTVPVYQLPPDVLRYILPSRYCDSDKLMTFAWKTFGPLGDGATRVQEICDWVHTNIEYRFGSGSAEISASEVILRRYGVCRDFAHCAIAICRCFNIPARYVTGHLPDIGHLDPGTPMDFHAYFEVFLGQHWSTFDARFNEPRIGRIKIAHGLDAVDGAFSTIYGESQIKWFEVWAYQINPAEVSLGDPVDLSKRLDGTSVVRRW